MVKYRLYNSIGERFYNFKVDDGSLLHVSAKNKKHAIEKAKEWSIWVTNRGYKHDNPKYIGLVRQEGE